MISEMTVKEAQNFVNSGSLGGGMLPKLQNCIDAIENGVSRVHILTDVLHTVCFWKSLLTVVSVPQSTRMAMRGTSMRKQNKVCEKRRNTNGKTAVH